MVNLGFFGGIFSGIDATFIFWVIAFLICLGVTNFIFTRFFKNQKIVGTSIAILTSIAIVYFTSRKYPNFLNNIFYSFGMNPNTILQALPWIGLGVAIIVVAVWGFAMLFMIGGAMLIISGATGLTYNQTAAIIIGVALFLIGLWLWYRRKKKKKKKNLGYWEKQDYLKGKRNKKEIRRQKRLQQKAIKMQIKNNKKNRSQKRPQENTNKTIKNNYVNEKDLQKKARQNEIRKRAENINRIRQERLAKERQAKQEKIITEKRKEQDKIDKRKSQEQIKKMQASNFAKTEMIRMKKERENYPKLLPAHKETKLLPAQTLTSQREEERKKAWEKTQKQQQEKKYKELFGQRKVIAAEYLKYIDEYKKYGSKRQNLINEIKRAEGSNKELKIRELNKIENEINEIAHEAKKSQQNVKIIDEKLNKIRKYA